jgi:hypothetical protein
MAEKSERELLQETHDSVIELSAVVLGVKGQGGLIQEIAETRQEVKLAVTEMKLKSEQGEKDVADLLNDVVDMKPKVDVLEKAVFGEGKEAGLIGKVLVQDQRIETSNKATTIVWTITGAILLTLLGLLVTHVL